MSKQNRTTPSNSLAMAALAAAMAATVATAESTVSFGDGLYFAETGLETQQDIAATASTKSPAYTSAGSSQKPWDGPYVGVNLGMGKMSGNGNPSAGTVGIQAGRDWQAGDLVVGIGADVNHGKVQTSEGDIETIGRVKVRGGYAFGNTLVFGSLGASHATSHELGQSWGHSVGVGVEHMLTGRTSLTAEVVQHSFDQFNTEKRVEPLTAQFGVNFRF